MIAKSIHGRSSEEINAALHRAVSGGYTPTLAIVFISIKQDSGTDAEALLIFSCAGRLSALGPLANMENEGLYDIWKAPMAGFFTYGEYGRALQGKQEFHSTTCCWVALKEK